MVGSVDIRRSLVGGTWLGRFLAFLPGWYGRIGIAYVVLNSCSGDEYLHHHTYSILYSNITTVLLELPRLIGVVFFGDCFDLGVVHGGNLMEHASDRGTIISIGRRRRNVQDMGDV